MLITAKYVFPVTSAPILNGAVLVRGDSIADIGDFDSLRLRYPDGGGLRCGRAHARPD